MKELWKGDIVAELFIYGLAYKTWLNGNILDPIQRGSGVSGFWRGYSRVCT